MSMRLVGMRLIGMRLMGMHLVGVHLMGMQLMGTHLMRGSHRHVPYLLHEQHLVQPRRSLDGKAPYPGA